MKFLVNFLCSLSLRVPLILLAAIATMCVCHPNADAFPQPFVQDRLWGVSAPWIQFNSAGPQSVRILRLTKLTDSTCLDPVGRAGLGLNPLCGGAATTLAEGWIHVFSKQTRAEAMPAIHFVETVGTNVIGRFALALPSGDYALLVHGGADARGVLSLETALFALDDANEQNPLSRVSFLISDNIFVDVSEAPDSYSVESVIVSDGPLEIDESQTGLVLPGKGGNTLNDWMGVQATEVWYFDGTNMQAVAADLQMSGVGPAGRLSTMRPRNGYVLVRPFVRPAFALANIAVDDRENPLPPGPGRMRVVFNTTTDSDHDRLGDQVENELHTCNGIGLTTSTLDYVGVNCDLEGFFDAFPGEIFATRDPRDTDGDGISDGAEVLGADSTQGRRPNAMGGAGAGPIVQLRNVGQTFPAWGFNPLHKDMLVEIDRLGQVGVQSCTTAGQPNRRLGCPMTGGVFPFVRVNAVGTIIGQPLERLTTSMGQLGLWHRGFNQIPAGRANNPDGKNGIEAHFDVSVYDPSGVIALPGSRLFNLWTQRAANVPFERFGRSGLIIRTWQATGGPWANANGSECGCLESTVAPDPRHGGFSRWALGIPGPGGQNGCNQRVFASIRNIAADMMHEQGHTFGLDHGGPLPVGGDPSCPTPFGSPQRAGDFGREDKSFFLR